MNADPLADASRCLLAAAVVGRPVLAPTGVWYDGTGLWLSPAQASPHAAALLADPRCAGFVPSPRGGGAVFTGVSRVFGLGDPVGLALHSPAVAASMGALALRQAGALVTRLRQADLVGLLALANRVAIRIAVVGVEVAPPPAVRPGVAPALPTVVPPEVRRILAGRRDVVVAINEAGLPRLVPATWGARFALDTGDRDALTAGQPVAVALDDGGGTGLRLDGMIDGRGLLHPESVAWWHGGDQGEAAVPSPSVGLELPD